MEELRDGGQSEWMEGALNSDRGVQPMAQANRSRNDDGGRAEVLPFSARESMHSSLKFTARLPAEDTWQAFAQSNSQPHTTSWC